MSYAGGEILAPVNQYDIQRALGTSITDIGSLCSHANINKWAKYKPVRYPSVSAYHTLNPTVPSEKPLSSGLSLQIGADEWTMYEAANEEMVAEYLRPTGGSNSPYRITDFNGYYHGAVCPISISGFNRVAYGQASNVEIRLDMGAEVHNLRIDDVFDTTTFGTWRFALLICEYSSANEEYNPIWVYVSENNYANSSYGATINVTSFEQITGVSFKQYRGVVVLANINSFRAGGYAVSSLDSQYVLPLDFESGIARFDFVYEPQTAIIYQLNQYLFECIDVQQSYYYSYDYVGKYETKNLNIRLKVDHNVIPKNMFMRYKFQAFMRVVPCYAYNDNIDRNYDYNGERSNLNEFIQVTNLLSLSEDYNVTDLGTEGAYTVYLIEMANSSDFYVGNASNPNSRQYAYLYESNIDVAAHNVEIFIQVTPPVGTPSYAITREFTGVTQTNGIDYEL